MSFCQVLQPTLSHFLVRHPMVNVVSLDPFDVNMGRRSFRGASLDNLEWSSPDGSLRVDSSVGYVDDEGARSNIVGVESFLEMSPEPSGRIHQVPALGPVPTMESVAGRGSSVSTFVPRTLRGKHDRDSYVV